MWVCMSVSWNTTSKTYPLSRMPAFIGINKANMSVWIHTASNPMWKKVFYSSSLHSHVILCDLIFMALSWLCIKSAENSILLKRCNSPNYAWSQSQAIMVPINVCFLFHLLLCWHSSIHQNMGKLPAEELPSKAWIALHHRPGAGAHLSLPAECAQCAICCPLCWPA